MSFADPQTITVNSIALAMPRTSSGDNRGILAAADGNSILEIGHQYGKRTRRAMKFTTRKIAADPLISAQNIQYSMSATLVVDVPPTGYTVAEAKLMIDGFLAYLTASSGAKVTQFLGGES